MDSRHKWIFQRVAEYLRLEPSAIQEAASRGPSLHLINDFLKDNGPKKLMFFYQPPQKTNEYGETVSMADRSPVIIVTDGTDFALRGLCVYFLRTTTKAITTQKIEEDVSTGLLHSNFLEEVVDALQSVRKMANVPVHS